MPKRILVPNYKVSDASVNESDEPKRDPSNDPDDLDAWANVNRTEGIDLPLNENTKNEPTSVISIQLPLFISPAEADATDLVQRCRPVCRDTKQLGDVIGSRGPGCRHVIVEAMKTVLI
jgi:hypothetical protein